MQLLEAAGLGNEIHRAMLQRLDGRLCPRFGLRTDHDDRDRRVRVNGARSASMPFISGISPTSMVMTSGLRSAALATASRPLTAVSITRKRASRWICRTIALRMKLELSTTRTRMIEGAGCPFSMMGDRSFEIATRRVGVRAAWPPISIARATSSARYWRHSLNK